MDKKIIQKRRMMKYFIDATQQIIENESFDLVTARKVSNLAGFNSATIYNYFKNLDELLYFSCIKYLADYSKDKYDIVNTKNHKNTFEYYINIWKCFCYHSYRNPKIYFHLFFTNYTLYQSSIEEYFEMIFDDIDDTGKNLLPSLLKENIYHKNLSLLNSFVRNNIVSEKNLNALNEMIICIYQSMLYNILNNLVDYSIDTATEKTLKYINQTILSYTL
ncbi:TetR/AcrR family transcriptional regulator [Clostridium sp. Marseille-Q2269]|uniref:TetR/AcrR family transcriptional regulator n=1 Tax=Clostridium sp. Marseille-Q2269 TaxID=2942205 RepID=UPI0020732780|nr:TetR/AcrR family transcriptional regulator [Clostridium sp. Marseille-Q2269]